MIGYFIKAGDPETGEMFRPYIGTPYGLGQRLKRIENKDYGTGMDLLLIQLYVEGKFPIFGPEQLKVRNYSTKEKAIVVAIPVNRSSFHDVGEIERRQFLVNSTLNAINAVRARLQKRKLDIDFDTLYRDVQEIGQEFITSGPLDGRVNTA